MPNANWTHDWPTEAGYYFCFGYRSDFGAMPMPNGDPSKRRLLMVEVAIAGNKSPVYICGGAFLYKEENKNTNNQWHKIQTPALPQE